MPQEDFVQIFSENLRNAFLRLRDATKEKWNRVLPFGDVIGDRWEKARACGFGEGTNIYDSVVVLGDVRVGKNCWIGPNSLLDGSGGLDIGDNVVIGVGCVIFSHSSMQRDLTGGDKPIERKRTQIGSFCRLSPYVIVEMGVTLHERCVVHPHSVITQSFPGSSVLSGNPAKVVGQVDIEQD
jgi:acetyltransferase-like isoleucine patch superfamily enzyme